ncbi:Rho GTPase activation protein [Glomus cerebriforme]|uniref:Rho GTPase activation protein n=1 Tax=Glomus cerebriforme TaxID=658196 RepID=A0A397SAL4_9GLOM|nr:Rho GTPase activation protein [Glomus cerebriforme]
MDPLSEKDLIQSAERQRKAQSLDSHNLLNDQFSNPPPSPNSPRKSRPISMFVHPQEKLNQTSETLNNNNLNIMPTPENTIPPSTPFSLASEVDVASINSVKTVETNNTGDQESLYSDILERANNPQGIIKMLCELDGGLGIALERVKQDSVSAKEVAIFLRKRALLEEEYGRMMIKLAKSLQESHNTNDTKQGSYGDSWLKMLKLHESIGENRVKFAAAIQEISEDVSSLYKETDKTRKHLKDSGHKHEKAIQDSETALEKARGKYESHSEDWERTILQKNGDIPPTSKPRTLTKVFSKQSKSPTQLVKMEEDARNKAEAANATYRHHLTTTNATRHDYYEVHLPRMITTLKDTADECDIGLQYHLARYSYLFENTMMSDALVITPVNEDDGPALRKIVDQINNDADFYAYVQSYGAKTRKIKNYDIPYDQYNMSVQAVNIMNPKNIFGVDLAEQMQRDGHEVPLILVKCCDAIEQYGGLQSQGLYRVSGVTSYIQRLKTLFDRNAEMVDLNSEEHLADVNNITGVLKLWFRELPDPLFTREMYQEFINSSKITDDKKRVLELHERVNNLPDANYSTLKYFMGHLDKVVKNQEYNKMSVQNLGIVFGPTLMGSPNVNGPNSTSIPPSLSGITCPVPQSDGPALNDMGWQCKVVETILMNYHSIFVM